MPSRQLLPAILLAAGSSALVGCGGREAPPPAPVVADELAPVTPAAMPQTGLSGDPRWLPNDLPLLPTGVVMGVRPLPVMRATYEFAARHPEVMKFVPCFCGCERGGHQDNHDCFVGARGSDHRVTQWDTHAIGCEVCVDVAHQALQMHSSGASIPAIRDAIEKKFAPHFQGHTPTPMPKR